MHVPLIGEILCEMGLLTAEDVDRILDDQKQCRQKFGQIAIRMGLATAEQVWYAWAKQMTYRRQFVELREVGIDTGAVERVTIARARALNVVPLRLWGDNLVVAIPPELPGCVLTDLAEETGCQVHACMALPQAIQYHLDQLESTVHMTASTLESAAVLG